MKMNLLAASALPLLVACSANIAVGNASGGASGASFSTDSAGSGSIAGTSAGGTDSGDSGAGGPGVTWTDPTTAPDCIGSPASLESYSTLTELNALLIGQWRRCLDPQIPGEDLGVEFTADGKYYPLTFDATHQVVRRTGIDYEGSWSYLPPGSDSPINHQPTTRAFMMLNDVQTDAPQFTVDPHQLRITFSPVLSKYVPMTP